MRERVTLGVDVGGTKTLVMAVPVEGVTSWRSTPRVLARFATPDTVDELIDALVDVAKSAEADAAEMDVVAVGLGLAGLIALDGTVVTAPNTRFLEGHNLAPRLTQRLGRPVVIDNDANVAALASRTIDAPDADHVTVVALGTGIGGGFVVDDVILRGHNGFAAEPGHMVVEPGGRRCRCGQRGCWEQYASGSALGELAATAAAEGRLPALAATGRPIRGEDLTALVASGDDDARAVFAEFAEWVAVGVTNLVALFDPEVVLLCGGLIDDAAELVDIVRDRVASMSIGAGRRTVVTAAVAGPDTSAIGAALLARPV